MLPTFAAFVERHPIRATAIGLTVFGLTALLWVFPLSPKDPFITGPIVTNTEMETTPKVLTDEQKRNLPRITYFGSGVPAG